MNIDARYLRQTLLPQVGKAGQEKLKNARVLLVGCGGLGSPIAYYLAAAGVGHLGLMDQDVVDISNLQRQILFTENQVGKNKSLAAQEKLQQLNSNLNMTTYTENLKIQNAAQIIPEYHLVVDGTDNIEARKLINQSCYEYKKPWVYGSVFQFQGQISFFNHNGACYECLFSQMPAQKAPSCMEAGVLGVLPALVGSLQATEVLKYFLNIGELLTNKLLTVDALSMKWQTYSFNKDPQCKVCH